MGLQKGQEPAGKAGAVGVEEVAVLPVFLEIRRCGEGELGFLGGAVVVPGTLDGDEGGVEGQAVERCGWVAGQAVGVP